MITWVLLAFCSCTNVPIKVEGYDTELACHVAGAHWGKEMKTNYRTAWHVCIEGPLK